VWRLRSRIHQVEEVRHWRAARRVLLAQIGGAAPRRGAAMKASANEKRVELLFEVGCEGDSAGMLPKAEEELRTNIGETSRRRKSF